MALRLVLVVAVLVSGVGIVVVSASADSSHARAALQVECIEDPLGPVPEWTMIIHRDMVGANSDSEGRIAVGGNATLTNWGVASRLPVDGSRVDLAVGGNLNATNVGVNQGSITYGGSLSGNATAPNGTITQQPLDLDALFQEAQRRADGWQEVEANGTVTGPESGVLTLRGTDSQLNVFRVRASRIESSNTIRLRAPFGSSMLVNVLGDSYSTTVAPTYAMEFWNGSAYTQLGNELSGENAAELEALRRSLLWNFADLESLNIEAFAWHGSVLAPGAAVTFNNGQMNGTIVARSWSGTGQTHLHPPDQICLPDPGIDPPRPPDPEEPTDPDEPTIPPFTEDDSGEGGTLPGAAARGNFDVMKQAVNRRGRRVELLRARPGQLVRFRLFGYNLGFASVDGVVVCDRVPSGLRFVRASGDPTLRRGRLCWDLGTVDTQRQGFVTFRVRRSVCGRIVNRLTVRSDNGGRDSDTAQVSACRRALPRMTG